VPSQRLAAAREAFAWGDYDRAQRDYSALHSDPAIEENERRMAAYWAGRSALEAGDYPAALELLDTFARNYPADPQMPLVHLLMARAYEGLADWGEALDAYQAYLDTGDGTLAIYAYEGMGEVAMRSLDYERAAKAYADGLGAAPDNSWMVRMREGIAQSYLAQDKPDAAVEQYDAILSIARIRAYRARILYLAGQALLAAGDEQSAYERYLEAVNRYPEAYDSYLALVELVNADVPVDDYQRGLVDYHAEAYQPAIEAFTRHIEASLAPPGANVLWYLALSLKANGNLLRAVEQFQEMIDSYPTDEQVPEAWLEMAEAHAWRDDVAQAIQTYRDFAKQQPGSPLAVTALWEAAELEMLAERWTEAASSLRDLAARYPTAEEAPEALFTASLLDYRRAEFEAAREGWQAVVQGYPSTRAGLAARFWLGKAWLALDDADAARAAFEAAAEWSPTSYYGLRATEMLTGKSAFEVSQASSSPDPSPNSPADVEAWLSTWLPITGTLAVDDLNPAISGSPAFRRGDALLAIGRRSDALEEFEAIKDIWWDNPSVLNQLALAFRDRGLYRLSIICAERLFSLSPVDSRANVPAFARQLAYPRYYEDLVTSEARAQVLPPLLLFALIRQESLFEPSITSPADARGLTQVIPATGEWIAGRLGQTDFDVKDLWLPYVNVRYGAWYLSVQLATFDAQVAPALAAYNAGPGRIHRWLEDAPGDIDLFVEIMPYAEPRRYVRNVYENYAYYLQLYQPPAPPGGPCKGCPPSN
jgi:soluble lytic murein transglycosylase